MKSEEENSRQPGYGVLEDEAIVPADSLGRAFRRNFHGRKKITCNEIPVGKGARLTFDPVAGPFLEKLAAAAARGENILEYGGLSMQPTPFPLTTTIPKGLSIRGYTILEIRQNPQELKAAKQYIFGRLQDGRLRLKIAKTFPPSEAVEAYQYLESNAQVGTVVITI